MPNCGLVSRNPAVPEISDCASMERCCRNWGGGEPPDRANDGRGPSPGGSNSVWSQWQVPQYMIRLVGLVVALTLAAVSAVSNDDVQQDARSDWSRIETIPEGVRIKVRFHEAGASESVTVKGHFSSFSETSIVLVRNDGVTQSIQRESVQFVRVRRPFLKRRIGWIVGLGAAALSCALASCDADITPSFIPIFTASYAGPIGLVACFLSRTRLVYRSPSSID